MVIGSGYQHTHPVIPSPYEDGRKWLQIPEAWRKRIGTIYNHL